MQLIDLLNQLINSQNISFICVIHENPSQSGESKARGHLGTELINKASQVIQIGFERGKNGVITDLIAVKFLHSRNTKRLEPHYLLYSEESKGLVIADTDFVNQQQSLRAEKAELYELQAWLEDNLKERTSKQSLVKQLMDYFDCSDRTVTKRLHELEGVVIRRTKVGRDVYFEPLE